MVVHTFKTDQEELDIASDTAYGLGGGLWINDVSRAHMVARELRAGMVWVNSYKRVNPGHRSEESESPVTGASWA